MKLPPPNWVKCFIPPPNLSSADYGDAGVVGWPEKRTDLCVDAVSCTLHGWTVSNWSRGSIIVSYILSYSNNIIVSRHLIRHSIRISENIDFIFKEFISYYLYIPDQEGQLQELAGVEDGVVALVHHLHTGHLHHIVVLSGGVDDVSIPHLGRIRSHKAD